MHLIRLASSFLAEFTPLEPCKDWFKCRRIELRVPVAGTVSYESWMELLIWVDRLLACMPISLGRPVGDLRSNKG